MSRLRILIIGGYGVFGGRIVSLLESDPRLELIVAGRSAAKASAFVRSRGSTLAVLDSAAFDRDRDVATQLSATKADILVDASGPFQAYGEDRYRMVEACLAQRVHYLDLADGSDFVAGVSQFDSRARTSAIFVLSGVSSFPVLTAAVVRKLAENMERVDTICGGIAPSPFAGVGENVIRAIASYAGQPISIRREGGAANAYPFTEQRRFTVAVPGRLPLKSTLFSLVDVPDLRALTEVRPEAREIWMGAGPVPEILHRALIACAWLVRLQIVPTLSSLAPLMHFAMNHFRWGEHRGGMFVTVSGPGGAGKNVTRSWHLLAEGDDGPLIPSMAIEAIVHKVLEGAPPPNGARAAVTDLELVDYERLFSGRTIYTGVKSLQSDAPLYATILGDSLAALPAAIRDMHDVHGNSGAEGVARVTRGRDWLARIVAALVGFPHAGEQVPVRVQFTALAGVETWTRTFGGNTFSSRQFAGRGRSEGLVCEQFGPLTFAMALVASAERLTLVLRRWAFCGVPLPLWLGPRSDSYESVRDGKFCFHVDISHPLTGLIVRYEGELDAPIGG